MRPDEPGHIRGSWTLLVILVPLLLLGLPLLGAWIDGQALGPYLQFPPIPRPVQQPPFNAPLFTLMAAAILLAVVPFMRRALAGCCHRSGAASRIPLPWWGWAGLSLGCLSWILAWNRFAWFAPLQPHTFAPLWLAYILVMNALTFRRRGECLMTRRPGYFVLLFPVSAAFWWIFEYLNRFVANWHYQGVEGLSPLEYAVRATIPFATVLPAVLSTYEWLRSCGNPVPKLADYRPLQFQHPRCAAFAILGLAACGLAATSVYPTVLYPLLWLAPVAVMSALRALLGFPTIFAPLRRGDWRRLFLLAMAALICGGFWEMWNMFSLARWEYTVPFVQRWHLFEMPVIGYTGYLTFGWECGIVANMVGEFMRVPQSLPHRPPPDPMEIPW